MVTTKAMAKVAAVATGLAMATSMLSLAPIAHAATLTDAQVQSILTMISSFGANAATVANVQAALTGQPSTSTTSGSTTSSTSSCSFSRNLTVGSQGADVTCLQQALIGGGFSISAGATGYFGTQTRTAVASWQSSKNIAPAVGYFGSISRAAFNLGGGGSTTTTTTTTTTTGTASAGTGTGLKVSLSATSPNGTVLVQGQGIGDLGDFVFANPTASPINVTALSFKRIGVSNDSALTNVYLFSAGTRLTDSASVNNSAFSFADPSGIFTVPAGQTYTVSVRSDILSTANGQQIGVSLVSATSNGTLDSSVSFPINSGYQTVSAATMATVSFNATTLPNGNSLTLSPQNDYPVWQNTVAVSTNPVKLSSLKLTNLGSLEATSMLNLRLYVDGVTVGTAVAQLGSDRTVTFDLSAAPVALTTQNHVIKVLANIANGASRTFALSIQRSSDVMFIDSQLNQPVTPVLAPSSTNFSAVTASTITVNAVTASSGVSVTKSSSSPTDDVSVGASGVKLGSFDLLPSGEDVKVNDLYVCATTAGTGSGTGLNNGKVYLNGSQVGSTKDLTECSSANTDFSMGSSLILPAGVTSHVEIYADAQNAAGTNLTGATASALVYLKYIASNAQGKSSLVSTAVPGADTAANTISITASTLTASKYSGYANQTLLAGTTNALLGSFNINAGSTEGLNVNTIELDLTGAAKVTNLHLVDHATGATIGTTMSTPATTNNAFSVSISLAASGSKTIDIRGDILSSATTAITATLDTTTTSTGANTGTSASLAAAVDLQTITVGAGTLSAVRSASNPASAIVLAGGTTPINVAAFTFSAVNSPWTVQKISIKIPADAASAVSSVLLSYKDATGATKVASTGASLGGGGGSFTAPVAGSSNQYATAVFTGLSYYVPINGQSDLTVQVVPTSIASGGAAISGHEFSARIDYNEGFQALDGSGTATTTPYLIAADVSGQNGSFGTSVLRKSKPTFAGLSYSNSAAPTSQSDLFRFTVSADTVGPVDLYKVSFNITTAVMSASSLKLYDVNDTATALNTAVGGAAQGSATTLTLDQTGAGYVAIPAGGSKTFVLRGTIAGTWAAGANIATSFASADTASTTNAIAASVGGTPSYVWSDESANSHSTTSSDWTNGYLLRNLTDGSYNYTANL